MEVEQAAVQWVYKGMNWNILRLGGLASQGQVHLALI